MKTSNGSFSLVAFYNVKLTDVEQYWMDRAGRANQ
jgi:hypothetical protein